MKYAESSASNQTAVYYQFYPRVNHIKQLAML